MATRARGTRQGTMWVSTAELPKSAGHPFYERLNRVLDEAGFDAFVEGQWASFYADGIGRPSLAPGRYFRLLLLGYFDGLDSERAIVWRVADRKLHSLASCRTIRHHEIYEKNYMQVVAISITLITAIVGIFWNTSRRGQIGLVVLAVLASVTALWQAHDQSSQIASAQRKLTSLVRVANPNATFFKDVADGFKQVALEHGLSDGNVNSLSDGNSIIHFRRKASSEICGVLRISPYMVQTIFEKYSRRTVSVSDVLVAGDSNDLVPHIRTISDARVTETRDHDELLRDIAYITQFPLKRDKSENISATPTVETDRDKNKIIVVKIVKGRELTNVEFDAEYLKSVISSPLLERGRLIFSKVWPDQAGSCDMKRD